MAKADKCKGRIILDMLKEIKRETDQVEFIEDIIDACAPKKTIEKPVRKKRQMSGYNCFMKHCAKEMGDFKACLKSGAWKKIPDSDKQYYNDEAKKGCPIE